MPGKGDTKLEKGSKELMELISTFFTGFPEGEPFQRLDISTSEWKPFGELGKAERIEQLNPRPLEPSNPFFILP
jgi:hypothetical protein